MSRVAFAYQPSDTPEERIQKDTIFLVASSCCVAGSLWSLTYAWVFGWGVTALLPLGFVVVVGTALLVSHHTKNCWFAVHAQVACIIFVTTGIQWSIGSLADSGFVMAWALCGPLTALFFYSSRGAIAWFAVYLATALVTVVACAPLTAHIPPVGQGIREIFLVMNVGASSLVVFVFASHFVSRAAAARARSRELLLNVLPVAIAPRLEAGEAPIADHFEAASVLFVDMVGSTPLFEGMAASAVVEWINDVFTMFDRLVQQHGAEKIRTIGDNYMVAVGVPVPRADHAQACTALALDMLAGLAKLPPRNARQMRFRFGINSGPLIAGVIGEHKFQYDLWGDTVNTASRMESSGEVGRIQVTAATKALIEHAFDLQSRGRLSIKGKGDMETWFVLAPRVNGNSISTQPTPQSEEPPCSTT